ncbi:hypothetical protein SPETJ133_23870 [Staphylococcus petrasii]
MFVDLFRSTDIYIYTIQAFRAFHNGKNYTFPIKDGRFYLNNRTLIIRYNIKVRLTCLITYIIPYYPRLNHYKYKL